MSADEAALIGCLLGTAVGDSIGLPFENLSRRRAARFWKEPVGQRLFGRRGMVSDDTEHACLVAQSLIASGADPTQFEASLARQLRGWLLSVPAGVGLATLKACAKLCVGFSANRSGVFSAGNGPAMRSPLLGVVCDDTDQMRRLVRAATRITHTDPKAEFGAVAVALAAHLASRAPSVSGTRYAVRLRAVLPEAEAHELLDLVDHAVASASRGESSEQFADSIQLGRGVTGYMYHTVPVVLHAWLANPRDFRGAIGGLIRCGGDTDTTAAIAGAIVGSSVGKAGIPADWLDGLFEWPRSVAWMERLARAVDRAQAGLPTPVPRLPLYGLWPRNAFFLAVVLAHGFRRLLPPY